MSRTRKQDWWIIWPDGSETRVTKVSGGWRWRPQEGGEAVSSHLSNLRYQVELDGGRLESRANPDYDPEYVAELQRRSQDPLRQLRRLLR